jgi:hypothetical protein
MKIPNDANGVSSNGGVRLMQPHDPWASARYRHMSREVPLFGTQSPAASPARRDTRLPYLSRANRTRFWRGGQSDVAPVGFVMGAGFTSTLYIGLYRRNIELTYQRRGHDGA